MAGDRINFGINFDVGSAIKELGLVESALKSISNIANGMGMEKYWKTQEQLVTELRKSYQDFLNVQSKDSASELIKTANALKAIAGIDITKSISGLGDITDTLSKAAKLAPEIANSFSPETFRSTFDVLDTLKKLGFDVNDIISRLSTNSDVTVLNKRIEELGERLSDARNRASSLEQELSDAKSGAGITELERRIEGLNDDLEIAENRLRRVRAEAESEFDNFLRGHNIQPDDWEFSSYYENIRDGSETAIEAISRFRVEYQHLFDQADQGNTALAVLDSFQAKIDRIIEETTSLSAAISDMQMNGVKTSADGASNSLQGLADAMMAINNSSSDSSASGVQQNITSLVERLNELAGVDVEKLQNVRGILLSIVNMNGLSVTKTPVNNISALLDTVKTFGKDGSSIAIPDFSKLNNLSIDKEQLKTLASYLPKIAAGNYAGLHELEGVTFDNLKNLSLENSIASIKAIASLTRALNGSDLSSANAFLTGLDFSKIQNVGVDEKLGAFATALSQLSKVPFEPLKNILSLSFQNLNSIDIKDSAAQSIESLANSMSKLSSSKQELKDIIDFISQYQASAASAQSNSPLVPPSVPSQISSFDKIRQSYSGLSEDQDNLQSELRETSSALSDCILKWQEIETYTKNESTGQNDISSQQLVVVRDYKALAELKERNEEKSRKEAIAINDLQRAYEKYAAVLEKTSNAAKGAGMSGNSDLTELDTLRVKLDSLIKNIATASPDELKQIQVEFSKLHKEADAAQTSVGKALNAIKDNAKADEAARRELITVNDLQDAYGKYAESLNKSIKQAEEAGLTDDDRVKTLRALRDEVGKLAVGLSTADSQGIKDAQLEFSELHKNADIAKRSVDSAVESIRKTERASEATQREINSMNRLAATIDAYIAKLKESKQAAIDAGVGEDSHVKSLDNTIDAFEKLRKSMDSATPPNYEDVNSKYLDMRVGAEEARRSVDDLATAQSNLNTQQEKESADTYKAIARYEAVRKQIINDISKSSKAENGASAKDYQALLQYRENVEQLFNEYNSGAKNLKEFRDGLESIANGASGAANNIRQAGEMTMSFGDRIKKAMGNLSAYFGVSRVIMQVVRYARDLIKTSIELDKEMGQLRIVTDETEDSYSKFSESIAKTAKEISASMTDLISATTTFARLGYSLDESSVLAKYTAMLQQVGDIDASAAQNAITAITKAFANEVDVNNIESVMDRLVTVGRIVAHICSNAY